MVKVFAHIFFYPIAVFDGDLECASEWFEVVRLLVCSDSPRKFFTKKLDGTFVWLVLGGQ